MKQLVYSVSIIFIMLLFFACPVNNLPPYSPDGLTHVFNGSGAFYNLKTGQTSTLPSDNLLNILIISEGYMQADLNAGIFNSDVGAWITDAEPVEPLSTHKQVFNIWQYAIPSAEHVIKDDTRTAETAFKIPISSSGSVRDDLDTTAARLWQLVEEMGLLKNSYYPSGGKTHYINRNLVVAFLIYDPAQGSSGFSGIARRLNNPSNSNQRISAALARNTTHEFLHAFARLSDEYLEDDNGKMGYANAEAVTAAYLNNVVDDANCSTVPWNHLLAAGSINPGATNLVGAFGNANNGYHSEAKCLMNGSHDNAAYFSGTSNLRTYERLCNWCREITAFRLYERLGIFTNPSSDYTTWKAEYRSSFWSYYMFDVPAPVPSFVPECQ